jgi:hypothetical protein
MGRTLGLPLLLVSLCIGGYLYTQQTKAEGPTSTAVVQSEAQAQSAVAGTAFQGAQQEMQAFYAANGTYVGATLAPGDGVRLASAQTSSYCIETTSGVSIEHLVGPNGQAQAGGC